MAKLANKKSVFPELTESLRHEIPAEIVAEAWTEEDLCRVLGNVFGPSGRILGELIAKDNKCALKDPEKFKDFEGLDAKHWSRIKGVVFESLRLAGSAPLASENTRLSHRRLYSSAMVKGQLISFALFVEACSPFVGFDSWPETRLALIPEIGDSARLHQLSSGKRKQARSIAFSHFSLQPLAKSRHEF